MSHSRDPEDRVFAVDADGRVRFGDGTAGRRPQTEVEFSGPGRIRWVTGEFVERDTHPVTAQA